MRARASFRSVATDEKIKRLTNYTSYDTRDTALVKIPTYLVRCIVQRASNGSRWRRPARLSSVAIFFPLSLLPRADPRVDLAPGSTRPGHFENVLAREQERGTAAHAGRPTRGAKILPANDYESSTKEGTNVLHAFRVYSCGAVRSVVSQKSAELRQIVAEISVDEMRTNSSRKRERAERLPAHGRVHCCQLSSFVGRDSSVPLVSPVYSRATLPPPTRRVRQIDKRADESRSRGSRRAATVFPRILVDGSGRVKKGKRSIACRFSGVPEWRSRNEQSSARA